MKLLSYIGLFFIALLAVGSARAETVAYVAPGQATNFSSLQIDNSATVNPDGTLYFDVLDNHGSVNVASGDHLDFGRIQGGGTINIRPGGWIRVRTSTTDQSIVYNPAGGSMVIDHPDQVTSTVHFSGHYLMGDDNTGCTSWLGYHQGTLRANDTLGVGGQLWRCPVNSSADLTNNIYLTLQSDGNLVLYKNTSPTPTALWASNTVGSGATFLIMWPSGNLTLYDNAWNMKWTAPLRFGIWTPIANSWLTLDIWERLLASGPSGPFQDGLVIMQPNMDMNWITP